MLPGEGEDPLFDKTVSLPAVPSVGDTVGIDTGWPKGGDLAHLVEVNSLRWFVNGEEPLVEVWLTDDDGARRKNLYVYSGCRYGFEQMMSDPAKYSPSHSAREALDDVRARDDRDRRRD